MLKTKAGKIVGTQAPGMGAPRFLRFSDLQDRNIVHNWPTLIRWIKHNGFPAGLMLGPNTRAWTEQEVEDWLVSRRIQQEEVA